MNNLSITLNIKQLSEEIHLAVKTIRSTLVNNPKALPPRLIIPGQKSLRWLRSDVIQHYSSQKRSHGSNPEFSAPHQNENKVQVAILGARKNRGRPTKAEQVARRQVMGNGSVK